MNIKPQYLSIGFGVLACVLLLALVVNVISLRLTHKAVAPIRGTSSQAERAYQGNSTAQATVQIVGDNKVEQTVEVKRRR